MLDERGEIDRGKVAAKVFADPAARRTLEAIVFPWIEGRLREQVDAALRDPAVPLVVLDAAVMLEAGWDRICDRLVFVDTPQPVRLERIARQRGWTAEQVKAREAARCRSPPRPRGPTTSWIIRVVNRSSPARSMV